ncbi:histidinol-phosphatase HisJ family protein [Clostridium sp. Cult1]|uniref:histidinol-phosphatase HisJ family protein n=1 Tax=Clostridium sp. Cult1 TaxID=2079002 RepID=UPI001F00C103|nr:histidinol-phosphatase HisJ family protein [Clostridium sp. Cult1]MCF6461877.1 histidinol phosphatase [Clostridium sp. Cult1]
MYDCHIHSDFSIDGKFLMEEMVLGAIEKNMKSICFTDHIDFDVTKNRIDIDFRPDDYFKKIKQVKYKYMDKIEILAGVEIGMQPHLRHRYNEFINNNPFDFVIMSIHSIEREDIHADNFTYDKRPLEALTIYYEYLYQSIKNYNNYDVIGHIDYIDRYFEVPSQIPCFKEYYPYVKQILELIIQQGKGLEMNTAGVKYGLGYYHPKIEILKLYKELGGEIITIGSDAHNPEFIGYEYKEVEKLLRELEFKYIYLYKERKKFPIHIG